MKKPSGKKGKKVGVSSNSHEAIKTLLIEIEKQAISPANKGFEFNNSKMLMSEIEYFFSEDQGRYIVEIDPKNSKKVTEYKSGKEKLYGFFVGEIMKASSGKANPKLVNDILKEKLKKWLKILK